MPRIITDSSLHRSHFVVRQSPESLRPDLYLRGVHRFMVPGPAVPLDPIREALVFAAQIQVVEDGVVAPLN
ncbi:hypothetical protein JTE90_002154 [Oedothorax gibbosus]|uniref:Uncharacterized protein n=1 Tax=Oedothorax gibbosus TaxID=931172 RepID=A0AAV6V6Y2_9ARAC|nr:hypothetical protein JTE90_002154 [Oedothorax gibbosus]